MPAAPSEVRARGAHVAHEPAGPRTRDRLSPGLPVRSPPPVRKAHAAVGLTRSPPPGTLSRRPPKAIDGVRSRPHRSLGDDVGRTIDAVPHGPSDMAAQARRRVTPPGGERAGPSPIRPRNCRRTSMRRVPRGVPGASGRGTGRELPMCVQPQAVREMWADPHAQGRGLLARFAVVLPLDRVGRRDVRPPCVPEAVRAEWRAAIDRLLSFEPGDELLTVGLDSRADALYHDFQRRTEAALGTGDLAERRAWGGKLCGLVLRIALTLHALETWATAGRPDDFPLIDPMTMAAAISWGDYLAAAELHARRKLCESEDDRKARQLVEWIDGRGGVVTARDLAQGIRAYRNDVEGAQRDLAGLVEAGIGSWEINQCRPKGGRPTQRFQLGQAVAVTETPLNIEKEMGFGDSDTRSGCEDAVSGGGAG